jgi:hypothetical protein
MARHVFHRAEALQRIIVGQGMFVTSFLFLGLAIVFVKVGLRFKPLQSAFTKVKNKLMFSSVFRSQIQNYFPTCILVLIAFHEAHDIAMGIMKISMMIALPIFSWWFLKKN